MTWRLVGTKKPPIDLDHRLFIFQRISVYHSFDRQHQGTHRENCYISAFHRRLPPGSYTETLSAHIRNLFLLASRRLPTIAFAPFEAVKVNEPIFTVADNDIAFSEVSRIQVISYVKLVGQVKDLKSETTVRVCSQRTTYEQFEITNRSTFPYPNTA